MSHELDIHDLPEGVKSVNIKEQKVFQGLPFPLILSPTDAFKDKDAQFWNDWVKKNLKVLESLLLKYGGILFREFPFDNPKEFDDFAKAYDYNPAFNNNNRSKVRIHVVGNVYTANELPPGTKIAFHHELGHFKDYPHILFFYCDIPAKEGGETPIVLSNVIYRKMAEREPDFVNRLEKEGLRYVRVIPTEDDLRYSFGYGLRAFFSTCDKEEAERTVKAFGFDFEWLDDGGMKTITEILPAIRVDKRTGKKMWFNSIFAFATDLEVLRNNDALGVFFPNGDTVNTEVLETLKQVMDEVKVSFKWQRKDVFMIDNRTVQHARGDFFVPPRRILLSQYKDHQEYI